MFAFGGTMPSSNSLPEPSTTPVYVGRTRLPSMDPTQTTSAVSAVDHSAVNAGEPVKQERR